MKTLFSADALAITLLGIAILLLSALCFFYANKVRKSGWTKQSQPGGVPITEGKEWFKLSHSGFFWWGIILFVAGLFVVFTSWNDYRPHNEWLDGKIPARVEDSTRMSAQDMIDMQKK